MWTFCQQNSILTHCGLVTPYGDRVWVNIGPGNGLLPDGTKPLPEPILIYHQRCSVALTWEQFHLKLMRNICSKIILLKLLQHLPGANVLTHWGRVTHICVSKLSINGSDNGLWPGQCEAIIRINAGNLLIGPFITNFSKILIEIHINFDSRKYILKWRLGNGGHFVSASMY